MFDRFYIQESFLILKKKVYGKFAKLKHIGGLRGNFYRGHIVTGKIVWLMLVKLGPIAYYNRILSGG